VNKLADWHKRVKPYSETFLTLHTPNTGKLPQDRVPSEEEITLALTRQGKPIWTEGDFLELMRSLGSRGYGWLREEGVRRKLEELAAQGG